MYEHIDDRRIQLWLQAQYTNQGFREYIRRRTITLLKTIGAGVSQSEYHIYLGQRLELLKLLQEISRAHKIQEAIDKMKAGKEKEAGFNKQSTNKVKVTQDQKGGE